MDIGGIALLSYVILAVTFAGMYIYDQVHFIDPGKDNPKAFFLASS